MASRLCWQYSFPTERGFKIARADTSICSLLNWWLCTFVHPQTCQWFNSIFQAVLVELESYRFFLSNDTIGPTAWGLTSFSPRRMETEMRWPTFDSMKWVMRHRTEEMRAGSRLSGLFLMFLCLFCFEWNYIFFAWVVLMFCFVLLSWVSCLSFCFSLRVFFAVCLSTCFCFSLFFSLFVFVSFFVCFCQYFFLMVLVCCAVQNFRLPTYVWIRSLAFFSTEFGRNDSAFILSLLALQLSLFACTWYTYNYMYNHILSIYIHIHIYIYISTKYVIHIHIYIYTCLH